MCISAERGGELSWVKQGMGLPVVLEQAIFDADVDEIFTADSQHGVHIMQVLEERHGFLSKTQGTWHCLFRGG